MNFPSEILPNPIYKYIECDLNDQYLIRSVAPGDSPIIDINTGLVKQEHVCTPRDHAADLSTSLLGVFEIHHNQIQLTDNGKLKYSHYCPPDITVDNPEFPEHFEINSNKRYWVILIGSIHGTFVDYTKSNLPFTAECIVRHTPMKWNYWHFSIQWLTDDGFWHELSPKERKKITARLAQEARAHIAMFATIQEPNYSQLNAENYIKIEA